MKSRRVIQNSSRMDYLHLATTVVIREGEPGWEDAYHRWINGKNPTDDPEWVRGAYMYFDLVPEVSMPPTKLTKVLNCCKHVTYVVWRFVVFWFCGMFGISVSDR